MPRRFIEEALSDEEEDELFSYLNSSKIVKPSKLIALNPQQNLSFNEKSTEIPNSSNLSIKNEFKNTTTSYQPLLDVKTEVITDCVEICDDSTEFVASKVELLHGTDPLTSSSLETNENCKASDGHCESSDDDFGNYEYVYNDHTEVIESESTLNDYNGNFCAPKIVTETSPVCTNVNIDKTLPMQNVFASHMGNVRSGLDDRYYLINEKDWMSLISSLQVNKQSSQVDAFNSSNVNPPVKININETNMANNESEQNSVPGNSSQFTALSDIDVRNQCKKSPVKDVPFIDEQNVEVIYVKYENGQFKSVGSNSPLKNVIVHSPKKSPNVHHYDINHSNFVQAENNNPTRTEDSKGHSRFVRINDKLSRVFVKDDESFIEQVVNERNELINTSSGISDSDMTDNLSDHGAETAYFIDLEDWNQSKGEGRSMIQPINIQDNYYSFVQENQKESHSVAEQLYLQDGGLTIMSDSGTSKPLKLYSPVKVNHGKSDTSPVKSCLKLITLSPCKLVKSPSKNSCPDKTEIRNSSAQIIKNLWKNCKLDNMKEILPGAVNIDSSTSPSVIDIKPISKNYLISSDDDVDDSSDDVDDSLVKYMQRGYNKNDARSKKNKGKNAHSNNSLSTLSINPHGNSNTCESISYDKSVLSSKIKMKMRNKILNSSANAKNEVAISEENKCNLGSKSMQGEVIDMTLDISDDMISENDSTEDKNIRKRNKKISGMKNKSKVKNSQILDIDKDKSVLKECNSKILSDGKRKRKDKPSAITDKHMKLKQSPEENFTNVREPNVRRLDSPKEVSKCSEVGKKKIKDTLLRKGKNTDKLNLKFDFNKNIDNKVKKSNAVNNTRHNIGTFNVEKGDCRFKRRNTKRKHTTNQPDLGSAANQEKCNNPKCVDEIKSDIKVAKKTRKKCKKSMAIEADTVNTGMEDVPKKSRKCKRKLESEESKCDEVKGDVHIDSSELEDISRWRNIKKNKVDFLERLFQMKQKEATISGEMKATSPDMVESEIEKTKNITQSTPATVNCNIDSQSCPNRKKGTRRRGRKRKIERLERSLDDEECSSSNLCNVTETDLANNEDKLNDSLIVLDNGSNVTCKTCDLKHPIGEPSVSHDNCANNVNKLSSTNDRLSNELTCAGCLLKKGLANDRKTRKKRRKKKSDSKKMDISSISCGKFKRKKSLKQLTSKTRNVHRPKSDSWKEMLQDGAFTFDFNKDLRKTYKPLNVKELVKKILEPHSDIDIRKREKEKQTFRKRRRSRFKHCAEKIVRQRTMSDNEDTWFSDSGHNMSFPAFKFGQTKHQIIQIPENNEEKYHVDLCSVSKLPSQYKSVHFLI